MNALIRLASEQDAAAIAAVYAPYVTDSFISFEERPPDAAEMARRIIGERPGMYPWFVAEEEGAVRGFVSSAPFRSRHAYRWVVETSIYLEANAHGRGIGRQLLSELLETLERQGYVAAIGGIALPNPASVALHERLGFACAGTYRAVGFKMGRWLDVGFWEKDLAPRTASPREPLPFVEATIPSLRGVVSDAAIQGPDCFPRLPPGSL
jgi:phosphinothricin acetyltransferase